ncbi:MAG: endonuclease/exonuclease/phosphatase family protein [Bacteroidota bacterium]
MKKIIFLLLLGWMGGIPWLQAQSNDTLQVVHYNLLNFGLDCNGEALSDRYHRLGDILDHIRPDVLTVNEVAPNKLLFDGMLALSFAYSNQIDYGDWTNQTGSNIVNQLFFNTEKLAFKSTEVIPSNHLRDLNAFTLYHKASTLPGDTTFLTFIVCHWKAGDGTSDQSQRSAAATAIMDWVALQEMDRPIFLLGDLNVGAANETAFQTLVNHPNADIRFQEPINKQNGWAGAANAIHHTQSTRSSSGGTCGAGGGMDDRFDFILVNETIQAGNGAVSYVPESYEVIGNDGNSYNGELQCSGNTSVPGLICVALRELSDHLPVAMQVAISPTVGREAWWTGPRVRLLDQADSDRLGLQFAQAASGATQVRLLDLHGRQLENQIMEQGVLTLTFETGHLPTGMYLIQLLSTEGRILTLKWQKRI